MRYICTALRFLFLVLALSLALVLVLPALLAGLFYLVAVLFADIPHYSNYTRS
jgi:hypothetical protein